MSRAQRQGDCAVLGAAAEWVGKCASCRFSIGSDLVGGSGLLCGRVSKAGALHEPVKPQWTCRAYEYEPGSAA